MTRISIKLDDALPMTIRGSEAATRAIFAVADSKISEAEHVEFVMVRRVFEVMHSSSLPVRRIHAIAFAIYDHTSGDLQHMLTKLVRLGVLRSRIATAGNRGSQERLYEVNY